MVQNEKFLRQRKMLLILPLLVIPMLSLAFYGLGGGKGNLGHSVTVTHKGLNMTMPAARFDPRAKSLDKLGFYKQSEADSARLHQTRLKDPYYTDTVLHGAARRDTGWLASRANGPVLSLGRTAADDKADELLKKLDLLKGNLARQAAVASSADSGRVVLPVEGRGSLDERPRRLPPARVDPDLEKLDTMLDKILRIQHPSQRPLADTAVVPVAGLPVPVLSAMPRVDGVGRMQGIKPDPDEELVMVGSVPGSGFFDLDGESRSDSLAGDLLTAVIAGDQTLISGESVELRLSAAGSVGGVLVPRGTLLSGKAMLSGERLMVTVTSLRVGDRALAVSLEVLDIDGVPGIRVRGSINRDVSKESAAEGIGSLGVTTFDPSLGGQAAAAGMQAARSLLSRKVRLVRLGLPAGYQVFLRNLKSRL